MKPILLLTILVFIFCWEGFGQESKDSQSVPKIISCGVPIPDFKEKPWENIVLRFSAMVNEMQSDPANKGEITFSVTNKSEMNSAMKLQKRVLKYMKTRKIQRNRILMKTKKGDDYKVDFEVIYTLTN